MSISEKAQARILSQQTHKSATGRTVIRTSYYNSLEYKLLKTVCGLLAKENRRTKSCQIS